MSNIVKLNPVELALIQGDLSKLTSEERLSYYQKVCESVGLNSLTKPFEYMKLNGKEVLYSNKGCAEQLRSTHKISLKIVDKQKFDDVYVVTCEASKPDGRVDSSTGAVSIAGLKGEALANAMMKAETKAKRRVTLSICSLNMLDETEVETLVKEKVAQPIEEVCSPGLQIEQGEDPREIEAEHLSLNPGDYVCKFGKKYYDVALKDIPPDFLEEYLEWLKDSAKKKGQPLFGFAKDLYEMGQLYLKTLPKETDMGAKLA